MGNFLFNKKFNEFDQFAHEVKEWDLDFIQLGSGKFKAELIHLKSGKGFFGNAKLNLHFAQRGSPPPGCWTFAILSENSSPIVWHKKEITKNSLIIYHPGSEIDCTSMPGFEVLTLSFPESHLDKLGDSLDLPNLKKICNNYDVFNSSSSALNKLRFQLKKIVEQVKQQDPLLPTNPLLLAELDSEIPKLLLSNLSRCLPESKEISTRIRRKAIHNMTEYLNANPYRNITVGQLCKIVQVKERTLEYAIKEHFGVTPKTYLKAWRLNGVRHALKKTEDNRRVISDIANFWGFWHMGQFAADYKKLFGELPSDTLKNENSVNASSTGD